MRIILTVTGGPHEGQSFAFHEHDTFIVGRSDAAQFRLPFKDKALSRVHFMVEVNPPRCRLMDMASTNGTFVNGQRVSTIDLKDGDAIRGGKTTIGVRFDEGNGGAQEPSPPTRIGDHSESSAPIESTTRVGNIDSPMSEPVFPTLPRLTIETELGRGGMGIVYRARTTGGEAVAVKTITPVVADTSNMTARFLREASILRTLDHPRIVKFREISQAEGLLYFVMDLVAGYDADYIVRRDFPLPIGRAVAIAIQMLEALAFAHGKGFVHRDVKPKNVLIIEKDEHDVVRLADFGLARIYLDSPLSGLSFTGQVCGTYGYMAPEQITHFREAKPSADIYAAGATVYFLLTGQRVYDFPPNIEKQLLMILQEDTVPIRERRGDIPEGLAEIIHRALRRDPRERYAEAGAMKAALSPFV